MSTVKLTSVGYRSYESPDGLVDVQYCANIAQWRVRDNRYLPAAFDECVAFVRTFADAKSQVRTWTR